LYRDDWISLVARERSMALVSNDNKSYSPDIELITTELEILKENKQYEVLAIDYEILGNLELRDKYIEKALEKNPSESNEIFLRSLQDKMELVDKEKIENEITQYIKVEDCSQLARLYVDISDWENSVKYYCKSICQDLEEENYFSAAFYLKEMLKKRLFNYLFEKAYGKSVEQNDLWWQTRVLQELGWDDELEELIISNKIEIEESGDLELLRLLYKFTGEREKLLDVIKKITDSIRAYEFGIIQKT